MSQWYAIRTATRRERTTAAALEELGVTVFLPLQAHWGIRCHTPGKIRVETPLMPGYAFVLIHDEDFHRVLGVEGVHAFVSYINERGETRPVPIPLAAIIAVQVEEKSGLYDKTLYFKPKYNPRKGDRVKVMLGPWSGFLGRVLSTPKKARAHVMIEGPFGRGVAIEGAHLAPAA